MTSELEPVLQPGSIVPGDPTYEGASFRPLIVYDRARARINDDDEEGVRLMDPIRAQLAETERYRLAPRRRRFTADDLDLIQKG